MTHRSSFSRVTRSRSVSCEKIRVASQQILAKVSVGLKLLYKHIQDGDGENCSLEEKKSTNEDGHFIPEVNDLLAGRYQLGSHITSNGQSAVLVRAKDLYHSLLPVVIKIIHCTYFAVGLKEIEMLRKLKKADPSCVSHTVLLLNSFLHKGHICMVFPSFDSRSITQIFSQKYINKQPLLPAIRRVTRHLLSALAFLKTQNIIHADIKPENILLQGEDLDTVTLLDFGNSLHHTHCELSLYYQDFELQTLPYRAPEVLLGSHFSVEIDMWSLGCVLLELFTGHVMFTGTHRSSLLKQMMTLLGPLPTDMIFSGKFASQVPSFFSSVKPGPFGLMSSLPNLRDYSFASFLSGLLTYQPDKRLTPWQALQHPFMAHEICIEFFLGDVSPAGHGCVMSFDYKPKQEGPSSTRTMCPSVPSSTRRMCPSTYDLLRCGTSAMPNVSNVAYVEPLNSVAREGPALLGEGHPSSAVWPGDSAAHVLINMMPSTCIQWKNSSFDATRCNYHTEKKSTQMKYKQDTFHKHATSDQRATSTRCHYKRCVGSFKKYSFKVKKKSRDKGRDVTLPIQDKDLTTICPKIAAPPRLGASSSPKMEVGDRPTVSDTGQTSSYKPRSFTSQPQSLNDLLAFRDKNKHLDTSSPAGGHPYNTLSPVEDPFDFVVSPPQQIQLKKKPAFPRDGLLEAKKLIPQQHKVERQPSNQQEQLVPAKSTRLGLNTQKTVVFPQANQIVKNAGCCSTGGSTRSHTATKLSNNSSGIEQPPDNSSGIEQPPAHTVGQRHTNELEILLLP